MFKVKTVREKYERVLAPYVDFRKLVKIGMFHSGKRILSCGLDLFTASFFKDAPITSVEIVRLFSVLKNVLSDKRESNGGEFRETSCSYVEPVIFFNDF